MRLILCAALLALAGCSPYPKYTFVNQQVRAVELVDFDPPKRFSVTLRDVESKVTYDVYVAKRCGGYEERAIKGSRFMIAFDIYEVQKDENNFTFEYEPSGVALQTYFNC